MMENDTFPVTGTEIAAGGSMTITGTGIETGILIGIETGTAVSSATEDEPQTAYCLPRMWRAITRRWISLVPSPMVQSLTSR